MTRLWRITRQERYAIGRRLLRDKSMRGRVKLWAFVAWTLVPEVVGGIIDDTARRCEVNEFYDDCSRDGHPRRWMNGCRCMLVLYRRDGSRQVNDALIAKWAEGLRYEVAEVIAGRDPNGPAVLDARRRTVGTSSTGTADIG